MKTRTNVSIDRELLDSARKYKIILSSLLEKALQNELKKREEQAWKEENSENMIHYAAKIESEGVFSDEMRTF